MNRRSRGLQRPGESRGHDYCCNRQQKPKFRNKHFFLITV
jgi:hypothetical protein